MSGASHRQAGSRTARSAHRLASRGEDHDHWPVLQVAAGLFAFHFFFHLLRVLCGLGEETGLSLLMPAGPFQIRPAELIFGLSDLLEIRAQIRRLRQSIYWMEGRDGVGD